MLIIPKDLSVSIQCRLGCPDSGCRAPIVHKFVLCCASTPGFENDYQYWLIFYLNAHLPLFIGTYPECLKELSKYV